ncbi:Biotin carboxyl carrier protein of acetyl-CoA carboxylase [Limihaloglobus sulfuriphilus]|uniref:Biotin carboxyl carrier protein of acetyl-CoA carboxylase n=1 Tax=Limihaloglobus sulfuriphilus TaxID=1851148 RepID=A0A1Q2MH04_9BACT|nr:acetyl-CoA carboxylase biotin carboxyl carrier protein [Limihaloglobus sulfuriphilus]AQQ71985.1 Biotin carboxyl carrier protein of acetyl-CoA carboxylase [Limihaloglobus sulfuriphilus]
MSEDSKKTVFKAVDIEKMKELTTVMSENNICELEIINDDNKIYLRRPEPQAPVMQSPAPVAAPVVMPAAASANAPAAAPAADESVDDGLAEIISPIVGTFYTSPSPDADPFVKKGDKVSDESVVCIVEAMKVMNEIKAELSGVIEEILVSNGEAVEFGQPLFKVRQ